MYCVACCGVIRDGEAVAIWWYGFETAVYCVVPVGLTLDGGAVPIWLSAAGAGLPRLAQLWHVHADVGSPPTVHSWRIR